MDSLPIKLRKDKEKKFGRIVHFIRAIGLIMFLMVKEGSSTAMVKYTKDNGSREKRMASDTFKNQME